MDIGTEKKPVIIEPATIPVPQRREAPQPERKPIRRKEPAKAPERKPEKVPAR